MKAPERTVLRAIRKHVARGADAEAAAERVANALTEAVATLTAVGIGDISVLVRQKMAADVMLDNLRNVEKVAELARVERAVSA